MTTSIVDVPDLVNPSIFPTPSADTSAYNRAARAWADGQQPFANSVVEIAESAHTNSTAAKEQAQAAASSAGTAGEHADRSNAEANRSRDEANRGEAAADRSAEGSLSAWAAAAAANNGAGLPALAGKKRKFLVVNQAETGVDWEGLGFEIGAFYTGVRPPSDGLWLPAGFNFLQSSYPNLMKAAAGFVQWTPRTIQTGNYKALNRLGSTLVAVGNSDLGHLRSCYSTNSGTSWSQHNEGPAYEVTAMAPIGGALVAVGPNMCLKLTDAVLGNWTRKTSMPDGDWAAITAIDSKLVAVGENKCAVSGDAAETWGLKNMPPGKWRGLTVIGSTLVAVGLFGGVNQCATSNNYGDTWDVRAIPVGNYIAVNVIGTTLIAVGTDTTATSSDDGGSNWEKISIPNGVYYALTVIGEALVAVGLSACVSTVDKGKNWRDVWIPVGSYRAVTAINSQLVAVGAASVALTGIEGLKTSSTQFYVPRTDPYYQQWIKAND